MNRQNSDLLSSRTDEMRVPVVPFPGKNGYALPAEARGLVHVESRV